MAKRDVFEYLLEGLNEGHSYDDLKRRLVNKGFDSSVVDNALYQLKYEKNLRSNVYKNKSSTKSNKNGVLKSRNVFLVLLFSIITLGVYYVYWLVSTNFEMARVSDYAPNPKFLLWFSVPVLLSAFLVAFFVFIGSLPEMVSLGIIISVILSYLYLVFSYFWKYSFALGELSGFSKELVFALWVLIPPIGMIVSQYQLNKVAS